MLILFFWGWRGGMLMQMRDKIRHFTTWGAVVLQQSAPVRCASLHTLSERASLGAALVFGFFVVVFFKHHGQRVRVRVRANSPRYQGEAVVRRSRHFAAFSSGLQHLGP